ncbi:MAG: FtsX-like permease family protein [Herminiimonas sp.]|nr:FtsX-like permease family protein [Herminiimonas sp.]
MNIWLRQHLAALTGAFHHAWKARGSFALNALVVAIALALPIAGLTLLENMRPVSERLAIEPEISIFMAMEATRDSALALAPAIQQVLAQGKSTGTLAFIPRESALDALKSRTGMADTLATLGANPLPDAYVLKLANFRNAADAAAVDALAEQLKALPEVAQVQVDSAWIKRLSALLHVLRLALLLLAVMLAVVVIAVIFNTIRMQVLTQHDEIKVSRMVGATDSFIYRPFYYTGALLGLCAGSIALTIVRLSLQPMNDAISEFARLYGSQFPIAPLDLRMAVILLAISALLGLTGSLLSVRRHLARLD